MITVAQVTTTVERQSPIIESISPAVAKPEGFPNTVLLIFLDFAPNTMPIIPITSDARQSIPSIDNDITQNNVLNIPRTKDATA